MTRSPSDACFFVGLMSLATAAGAWLYGDSTWFTSALIVTLIATVAWAITHHRETKPIPYTTTIRYDIDQLFKQQRAEWEQRGTTMTPHQADTNWPDQHHLPVWPTDAGAPE